MMPKVAPIVAPIMQIGTDEQSKANALTTLLNSVNALSALVAHLEQKVDHIWTAIGQPNGMTQVEPGSLLDQLRNLPNEFKTVRGDIMSLQVEVAAIRGYMQAAGTGAYDALNTSKVQELAHELQERILGRDFMLHRRD